MTDHCVWLEALEKSLEVVLLPRMKGGSSADWQCLEAASCLPDATIGELFSHAAPGSGAGYWLGHQLTLRGVPPSARKWPAKSGNIKAWYLYQVLMDCDWLGHRYPEHRAVDGSKIKLQGWTTAEARAVVAHGKSGVELAEEFGLTAAQQAECLWFRARAP